MASCPTSPVSQKRCFGRCTIALARRGDPTVHLSIPRACTPSRRSTMTSRAISAFLWARSRHALSKSTGRYGLGSIATLRGSSYPSGRASKRRVDLPDAIRLREHFLVPTHRFRHIAASALDPVWMDAVEPSSDVFIVAQGSGTNDVPCAGESASTFRQHRRSVPRLRTRVRYHPALVFGFDAAGVNQTASFRLPSMPWGINRDEVEPTLRHWHPRVDTVSFLPYEVREVCRASWRE
jgi:hypothetical protein